jgi:hypothetical protein
MLENWYDVFFEPIEKKFPHFDVGHFPVITYEGHEELAISCIEDIDCAVALCEATDKMFQAMPNVWQIESPDEGDTSREEFITELIRVWKKGHKKCKTNSST